MKYFVSALGIIMCLTSAANGETIVDTVDVLKDTYIDAFTPTANHGFDDALTLWNTEVVEYFILIQFDLERPSVSNMPDTLEFLNGTMGMYCFYTGGDGDANIYNVATNGWAEGNVNYNNMPGCDSSLWVNKQLPTEAEMWWMVNVTPLLEAWWSNSAPHHGFYVYADRMNRSWDFYSKDWQGDTNLLPQLYMTYKINTGVSEDKARETAYLSVSPLSSGAVEVSYTLPSATPATLRVYDASGALVETLVDCAVESGEHSFSWDGAPGVYFIGLETPVGSCVRKAVLIR